jgi:hypothetical protein
MNRERDCYLLLMSYALTEMRFFQHDGEPLPAPRLADVFHGVPEALRLSWTSERAERTYEQIRAKAEAHGLTNVLDRWQARAQRRREHEREQNIAECNSDALTAESAAITSSSHSAPAP